jgi:positive regulator of sigma E activity
MKKRRGYKYAAKYIQYREVTAACAKRKGISCSICGSRARCGEYLLYREADNDLTEMNREFDSRDE